MARYKMIPMFSTIEEIVKENFATNKAFARLMGVDDSTASKMRLENYVSNTNLKRFCEITNMKQEDFKRLVFKCYNDRDDGVKTTTNKQSDNDLINKIYFIEQTNKTKLAKIDADLEEIMKFYKYLYTELTGKSTANKDAD